MGITATNLDYMPITIYVNPFFSLLNKIFNIFTFYVCRFDIKLLIIYTNKFVLLCKQCANGLVAQLVEQRTENPRVGGSNPSQAINKNQ